MRSLLLAALLLTVPLAGCLDDGPPPVLEDAPAWTTGTLLAYEVERENQTRLQTFLVEAGGEGAAYQLHPLNVSAEVLESPFLRLRPALYPSSPIWRDLVQFPAEPGAQYEALAGGHDVTVDVSEGTQGLAFTATAADGEQVARLELDPTRGHWTSLSYTPPEGAAESWRLVEVAHLDGWNDVPRWGLGDWWSYNATVFGRTVEPTLVLTGNGTASGGSLTYNLEPTRMAVRELAQLFTDIRQRDLASQSGLLDNLVNPQWRWPLQDGQRWSGWTVLMDRSEQVPFEARVTLVQDAPLPGGGLTTAFEIEAYTRNATDPFAQWNYVPLVGYFTHLRVNDPIDGRPMVSWNLTDWGHGYHGPLEIPHRSPLLNQSLVGGPRELTRSFEITSRPELLLTNGFLGRTDEAEPNATIRLRAPDGTVETTFTFEDAPGRSLDLRRTLQAEPGNWTLEADLGPGTSFFMRISGLWSEEIQLDCRSGTTCA